MLGKLFGYEQTQSTWLMSISTRFLLTMNYRIGVFSRGGINLLIWRLSVILRFCEAKQAQDLSSWAHFWLGDGLWVGWCVRESIVQRRRSYRLRVGTQSRPRTYNCRAQCYLNPGGSPRKEYCRRRKPAIGSDSGKLECRKAYQRQFYCATPHHWQLFTGDWHAHFACSRFQPW